MTSAWKGGAEEVLAVAEWPAAPPRRERLPQWVGLKGDAGAALDGLRLAIIGNGSVGLGLALAAARLQVKGLDLIDGGHYKRASLLTHDILPREAALAHPKALHAARLCKQISPATRVRAYAGTIQSMAMDALADADLAVLATDNVAAEVEVGKRCLHLRKPLVHAAVHGETLTAQVRFYRNADAAGACPACFLNRTEIEHLSAGLTFKCDGSGAAPQAAATAVAPTRSVSSLCGLAANLAMIEILKYVVGLGPKRGDFVLEYAGYTNRTVVTPLGPRPSTCFCDHDTVWTLQEPPRPLSECSLGDLAAAAGLAADLRRVAFSVDQMVYAQAGACGCGKPRRLERFAVPGVSQAGVCETCRQPVYADAFFSHRPAAAACLGAAVRRPLRELGAPDPRCVLVQQDDRAVLFSAAGGAGRRQGGA
jgi:molybdopterin/thiamine biosynthesis adenylyltransferase